MVVEGRVSSFIFTIIFYVAALLCAEWWWWSSSSSSFYCCCYCLNRWTFRESRGEERQGTQRCDRDGSGSELNRDTKQRKTREHFGWLTAFHCSSSPVCVAVVLPFSSSVFLLLRRWCSLSMCAVLVVLLLLSSSLFIRVFLLLVVSYMIVCVCVCAFLLLLLPLFLVVEIKHK